MLGFLRGKIIASSGQRILVEVLGVGYWVHTGSWQPEGEVGCFLYQHVREDLNELYGFESIGRLELFEKLLTVSGIGPKAALAILSLGSTEQLLRAIEEQNLAFLTTAPGVGSKAAQKIILELQGKLDLLGTDPAARGQLDLLEALQSLGYKPAEIREQLAALPGKAKSLDEQIRWILQRLNRS